VHPRLLTTPFFTIHTFGVLLAAAYLSALGWLVRGAKKTGVDPDAMASVGLYAIAGAVIGAKLLLILRSAGDYAANPSDLWSFSLLASAGDFYGGFIGGLIGAGIGFRRHRELPFWPSADLCAPAIALGQAIGRIGCFMAGDDYGRPTTVPWAVAFTDPDAASIGGAPLNVPLHPVQLYESAVCLGLFLFLLWLARRKRVDGDVILAYTILYAVARFLIEFLRGDADRGFVFGGLLSTSQFLAAIFFPAALVILVFRHRNGANGHHSRSR
jgi:phosphatidylglycerol---prolipoprotein diacylglyceryl transferase